MIIADSPPEKLQPGPCKHCGGEGEIKQHKNTSGPFNWRIKCKACRSFVTGAPETPLSLLIITWNTPAGQT